MEKPKKQKDGVSLNMIVKEVSISKIIMLFGVVITILYALYLGNENITLTALGIIGGYLAKDIETPQETENNENDNGAAGSGGDEGRIEEISSC